MSFYDYSQDRRLERLKDELDVESRAVDQSLSGLWDALHLERRRNDIQTSRIKVLAETLKAVLQGIAGGSPITATEANTVLQSLAEAMKPVNLKEPPPVGE